MNPWQELANAIVEQAVRDYRAALKAARRSQPDGGSEAAVKRYETMKRHNEKVASECEEFFRSKWFRTLTDADGDLIIARVRDGIDD